MSYQQHMDPEVQAALTKLCDALCQWERNTGRGNILILREAPLDKSLSPDEIKKEAFWFRAHHGKPIGSNQDGMPDALFLSPYTVTNQE